MANVVLLVGVMANTADQCHISFEFYGTSCAKKCLTFGLVPLIMVSRNGTFVVPSLSHTMGDKYFESPIQKEMKVQIHTFRPDTHPPRPSVAVGRSASSGEANFAQKSVRSGHFFYSRLPKVLRWAGRSVITKNISQIGTYVFF